MYVSTYPSLSVNACMCECQYAIVNVCMCDYFIVCVCVYVCVRERVSARLALERKYKNCPKPIQIIYWDQPISLDRLIYIKTTSLTIDLTTSR